VARGGERPRRRRTGVGPGGCGADSDAAEFTREVSAAGATVVEFGTGPHPQPGGAHGYVDSLVRRAAGRATLVIADDIHLADEPALRTLAQVAEEAVEAPVLVLASYAEGNLSASLGGVVQRLDPDGRRSCRLRPLTTAEMVRVASAYVGTDDALAATGDIAEQAAGLPARIHALLGSWARERLDRRLWQVTDITERAHRDAHAHERALVDVVYEINELEWRLTGQAAKATFVEDPCPYPGLPPYDTADAAYFCGRESLVARLAARIATEPWSY
jgi:hypothetical protein